MTALAEDNWKKMEEPGEVDVPLANTRQKGSDDSFFGELSARRGEVKKDRWTRVAKKWGGEGLQALFLEGIALNGALHWTLTKGTSVLEIQLKTKKIQGLCLLSLSDHNMLFLFAQKTKSFQFPYVFSFSQRLPTSRKLTLGKLNRVSCFCQLTLAGLKARPKGTNV